MKICLALATIVTAVMLTAVASASADPGLIARHMLNRDAALHAVDAVVAGAKQRKLNVAIVVVDDRGAVIVAQRLDGTLHTAIDLATAKARTSAGGVETAVLAQAYKAGETELATLNGQIPLPGGITLYAGGVPVLVRGEVVGAVGVSGAEPAQDRELAVLGADAAAGAVH